MATQLCIRLLDESDRRAGDVVGVRPYPNRGWGRSVCPPRYQLMIVDDLPYEEARRMFGRHLPLDGVDPEQGTSRCQRRVNWTKLRAVCGALADLALRAGGLRPQKAQVAAFCDCLVNETAYLRGRPWRPN